MISSIKTISFRVLARGACGLLLCGGLVFAVACKPKVADNAKCEVTGTVKYKGASVPGGVVAFQVPGDQAQVYTCAIKGDGTYVCELQKPGSYKVTVETESVKPPAEPLPPPGMSADEFNKMKASVGTRPGSSNYVAIPKKYAKVFSTPLSYEVKEGKQRNDIDLSD
jgi:hypothetical protein